MRLKKKIFFLNSESSDCQQQYVFSWVGNLDDLELKEYPSNTRTPTNLAEAVWLLLSHLLLFHSLSLSARNLSYPLFSLCLSLLSLSVSLAHSSLILSFALMRVSLSLSVVSLSLILSLLGLFLLSLTCTLSHSLFCLTLTLNKSSALSAS